MIHIRQVVKNCVKLCFFLNKKCFVFSSFCCLGIFCVFLLVINLMGLKRSSILAYSLERIVSACSRTACAESAGRLCVEEAKKKKKERKRDAANWSEMGLELSSKPNAAKQKIRRSAARHYTAAALLLLLAHPGLFTVPPFDIYRHFNGPD